MRPIFMRPLNDEPVSTVLTDIGSIPWDAANARAADFEGKGGRDLQAMLAEHGMIEPDPYVPAPAPPPSFLARDFLAQLGPADAALIRAAIAGNDNFWLLWQAMTGQGDAPIITSSERFVAGWAAIKSVLGPARAAEIAAAVGITG